MNKSILILLISFSCLFISFSHAQFEYKADLTKAKTGYGYYGYSIGNILYYLGSAKLMATNLDNGLMKETTWENLAGKFFNKEILGNTRFSILNSAARSSNGNLQIIIAVSIKSKDFTFVKVEIDKDLTLVKEEELLNIQADNYFSHKEFKTNPETGESVFVEYVKSVKGPDLIRTIFFNANMELVSKDEYFYDIPYNNVVSTFMDQLNSLFVVSENTALFSVNKMIYSVANGKFKPFSISVGERLSDFIIKPRENNGFTLIGYYQTDEEHGLVVCDFDDELGQLSEDYIELSKNLLANSEKQMENDFSAESFGILNLIDVFFDKDGTMRLFAGTIVKKKKDGIPFEENNLTMITINAKRQIDKSYTLPTKSSLFQNFLNGDDAVKVLFVDSPKSYDKSGEYIPKSNKNSSREDGTLVQLVFSKSKGELISRRRLKFSNSEQEIEGTIVYPVIIDGERNSLILSIFRYPKNDHLIGKYK